MPIYEFDLGVIGGGAAGLTVAAGCARLGAKTLLVEKEEALGGDCLHYGCVPSKTLIRTAQVYHQAKNFHRYGLPDLKIPPVDFSRITGRIQEVIDLIQQHDSVHRFCSLGVKVEFGGPEFVDDHEIRINGRTLSAKNWVVATGSSAGIPHLSGLDKTPFLTNRDLFSLPSLPSSMIILGGGPIALEMAQAFNRLGTRVEVVQRSGEILSKEDADLAESIRLALTGEGVIFHLGAVIERIADLGKRREVVIKTREGPEKRLTAEAILAALGREANTAGLELEKAGVSYNRKGIQVDGRLRTSQKHIYAAGDVNGVYQFTHAAGYEGGLVVSNAIFRVPRKAVYTYLPRCTYTEPELAGLGLNEREAEEKGLKVSVFTEEFKNNDRSLAEGHTTGRIKMILDERERPLGVFILGPRAGDLLAEWVAVFNGGVKLTTLAGAVHPYPTLGEINKKVAGNFLGTKIFSDRVKKTLKFFFDLKGRAC